MPQEKPLYATQGGGYAVFDGARYVWHSDIPNFINAQVGDPIPEDWGVVGVNEAARHEAEQEFERDELGLLESSADEFYRRHYG